MTASTDRLGQTERHEYEPVFNNPTSMTDKVGRVTRFGYDARGNLTSVIDALSQTTSFMYDQFGEITSVTDPLTHTSRVEYDAQGNVTARENASTNRSTMEYDGIGRVTAVTDPLSRRTSMTYDAMGRMLAITDPTSAVTHFSYDANGNQTNVIDALTHGTSTAYDTKNRPTAITDAISRVSRIEYDRADEVTRVISPSGRLVGYSYDSRGQVDAITDGLGGQIRFRYDNRGKLVALTDQRGNTTTYSYDELYRPTGSRDPLGRASSIAYDANNNVVETVDRLDRRTAMSYDVLGRTTRASYIDAVVDYGYDASSRLMRIDDTQGGSISRAYDEANRVVSETSPAGVVSYSYNSASQSVSMTASDRQPVNYGYDLAGRLKTITQGAETFTYGYDVLSRRATLQRPNGVTTSYSYDEADRLVHLLHSNTGGSPIEDLRYTYSLDDEIVSITSLASANVLPASKTTSPADGANRIAQFAGASYSFDVVGQTISKTEAQGLTSYQWDARGRLTRATLPSGQVVSYGYDALGRKSSRATNGTTTSFLYDKNDVVLDRSSDSTTMDYLNGAAMDEKLRMTAPAGFIYFALDHLGSAGALLDSAGGIVERLHYEPLGGSTGSTLTRYGYTGRENDAATELMYYRTRWYDPQQGRFVTEDSTRFGDGMNLFAYVQNNPVVFIDPWGRAKVYYWGPRLSPFRVGHLSIQLEDGTYISFWPGEAPSGIAFGKKFQATTHDTYGQDAEAEAHIRLMAWMKQQSKIGGKKRNRTSLSIGEATHARTRSAMHS